MTSKSSENFLLPVPLLRHIPGSTSSIGPTSTIKNFPFGYLASVLNSPTCSCYILIDFFYCDFSSPIFPIWSFQFYFLVPQPVWVYSSDIFFFQHNCIISSPVPKKKEKKKKVPGLIYFSWLIFLCSGSLYIYVTFMLNTCVIFLPSPLSNLHPEHGS